jgi:hypothetical protein
MQSFEIVGSTCIYGLKSFDEYGFNVDSVQSFEFCSVEGLAHHIGSLHSLASFVAVKHSHRGSVLYKQNGTSYCWWNKFRTVAAVRLSRNAKHKHLPNAYLFALSTLELDRDKNTTSNVYI